MTCVAPGFPICVGTRVDVTLAVGISVGVLSVDGVGVAVGAAAKAVSVKFATTVCAAAVLINATSGVGAEAFAGAQEMSKSVPIHAMMNNLVFIMILRFISKLVTAQP